MLLNDVRVIEIGQNLSAPYTGRILADLGADVIKVEKPAGGGDGCRMGPPFHDDDSLMFHVSNVNKRSVTLDLKDRIGLSQLIELVGNSDVLLHNLRPGAAESLGLDAATLRTKFPRLIYTGISPFGSEGPLRMRPGYDLPLAEQIQAEVAQHSTEYWSRCLDEAGIPYAPVATIPDVIASAQTQALRIIVDGGPQGAPKVLGMALSFDGERPAVARAASQSGAHNDECLAKPGIDRR